MSDFLLVGALAFAAACSDLFGPSIPDGTYQLLPLPKEYQWWWEVAETCSGLSGDLSGVEFRVLPDRETFPDGDTVGAYYRSSHQVVLVERMARDGYLVRHEMLHALLAENGLGGKATREASSRAVVEV